MITERVLDAQSEAIAAERRWSAWIAKGLEDDRRSRKHALVGAVVLAAAVAVALFLLR